MIYRSSQTDQLIDDSVKKYIEQNIANNLKVEVDNAIQILKGDGTIKQMVDDDLTLVVKRVNDVAIKDDVRAEVKDKVNRFATTSEIASAVGIALKDSLTFASYVAGRLENNVQFQNSVAKLVKSL